MASCPCVVFFYAGRNRKLRGRFEYVRVAVSVCHLPVAFEDVGIRVVQGLGGAGDSAVWPRDVFLAAAAH